MTARSQSRLVIAEVAGSVRLLGKPSELQRSTVYHSAEDEDSSRRNVEDVDLPLVKRLQDGDESALNELMERYKGPLFGFIYKYVQNESDAADLLEETFVKLYHNRHRFRPSAKFKTWLYTIAGNLCRDRARKLKRRPEICVEEFSGSGSDHLPEHGRLVHEAETPHEETVRHEEIQAVREAIQTLPHDLKTATLLYCLEGHTQEAVAERLGCSVKAVETRVYRAKKLLAKKLASVL